jgi:hypothetical protein
MGAVNAFWRHISVLCTSARNMGSGNADEASTKLRRFIIMYSRVSCPAPSPASCEMSLDRDLGFSYKMSLKE